MKLKKVISYLIGAKLLWMPPLVGLMSIVVFGGTIGWFVVICGNFNEPGIGWLIIIMGILTICYVVFFIKSSAYEDLYPILTGILEVMAIFPFFSLFACGAGIVIPYLFIPGFYETLESWGGSKATPTLVVSMLWSSLIVMATYTVLGIIFQSVGTVIMFVERLIRNKPVLVRPKFSFWLSILGMLAYLIIVETEVLK